MPRSAWGDLAALRSARSGWSPEQRALYEAAMLRNYAACFESSAGREVLLDLEQHYLYRTSHVPGDPYATAYQEGQRSVVLALLQAMDAGQQVPAHREDGA